jgi:hypothetical protein
MFLVDLENLNKLGYKLCEFFAAGEKLRNSFCEMFYALLTIFDIN